MKRRFRLKRSTDFKRVRRYGKSFAHPLIVLICLENSKDRTRIGVSAGRSLGNAVKRNRAKRRIREAVKGFLPGIKVGWDVVLLARFPLLDCAFSDLEITLGTLLKRASLI